MTEASDGRSTDVVADDLDDEREPATVPIAIDSQEPQEAADQAGATPSGALAATSPRNLSRSLVASFAA